MRLILALFIFTFSARASAVACAAGDAGKYRYAASVMEYCNEANWLSMKGPGAGACAAGDAGKQRYSSSKMQFCDGSNWYDMKFSSVAACVAGDAGKQRYTASKMQFCNGSNWFEMSGCTPIMTCADIRSGVCTTDDAGSDSCGTACGNGVVFCLPPNSAGTSYYLAWEQVPSAGNPHVLVHDNSTNALVDGVTVSCSQSDGSFTVGSRVSGPGGAAWQTTGQATFGWVTHGSTVITCTTSDGATLYGAP